MNGRKIAMLFLILGFGTVVETAWTVRNVGVGASGCRVLAGRFQGPSFTFASEQTEAVTEGTAVEVDNAFGAVEVAPGAAGEVKVSLRKVVFRQTEAQAREFEGRIRVVPERRGATLRIATNRRELEQAREGRDVGFETHLKLAVPPGTRVVVRNEHGRIDVTEVAQAEVRGSFEAIVLRKVAGAAEVQGRHADLTVTGIGGALTLSSRHGDVRVEDVAGASTLDVEHGGVKLMRVGGVTLSAAHGDVSIETVRGDLRVDGRHAKVQAADVAGRAEIDTSFRDVQLERVGGDARVKAHHGGVRVTDVKGGLAVEAAFDSVHVARIGGLLEVQVDHGGLLAESLPQGARVKASGDEVVLAGFAGPVDVDAQRAAVRLVPSGPLTTPVAVSTTHGSIRLEVPSGSRFDLEATSRRGDVSVDVPGLRLAPAATDDERRGARVMGTLGESGNPVKLRAEHGDVVVLSAVGTAAAGR